MLGKRKLGTEMTQYHTAGHVRTLRVAVDTTAAAASYASEHLREQAVPVV